MDTDTKQMSLSEDCTDARAFLCTPVHSEKKKKVKQLICHVAHGNVWLAIFIIVTEGHVQRKWIFSHRN